jgi:aspartyl/glutamyl-tRNA(Asn/Gln) amidotransferase C subunit
MAIDLDSILGHMNELERVPAEGAEALGGVSGHPAPFRQDVPGSDPLLIPIEQIAPEWRDHFFVVPRLAALDADALDRTGSSA